MKVLMVMFDSLNRRMLPPYGCDWVHAPSFDRLSRRAVTFDTAYVGSMPCMPARTHLMREPLAATGAPPDAYARIDLAPPTHVGAG
jgi:hypothetical protein